MAIYLLSYLLQFFVRRAIIQVSKPRSGVFLRALVSFDAPHSVWTGSIAYYILSPNHLRLFVTRESSRFRWGAASIPVLKQKRKVGVGHAGGRSGYPTNRHLRNIRYLRKLQQGHEVTLCSCYPERCSLG